MKRDEFGPKFEALLAEHPEGLTPAQLSDLAGSSRQRAYTWVQKNRHRLHSGGRTAHGATAYTLRNGVHPAAGGPTSSSGIVVGSHLLVRSMRWSPSGLELVMEADDGTEVAASIPAGNNAH
jgi:hypothetical protein